MKKKPETEEGTKKVQRQKRTLKDFMLHKPDEISHFNGIIYGHSGAGKTYLGGTAGECERTSPVLIIDFEGGTTSLHEMDEGIVIFRPKKWKEIQKMYEYLLYDNNKFKAVVLDSLTEMQKKHSMGTIMGELSEDEGVYDDLGSATAPSRQDWLRTGEQMKKVIRSFKDLAYLPDAERRLHVFMICLENFNDKRDMYHPTLSGALGIDCGASVDFLFRLSSQAVIEQDEESGEETTVTKRHLLTDRYVDEDDTVYLAKNRGSFFQKSIWNPTISTIMDKIPMKGGK